VSSRTGAAVWRAGLECVVAYPAPEADARGVNKAELAKVLGRSQLVLRLVGAQVHCHFGDRATTNVNVLQIQFDEARARIGAGIVR
jgi:hypothetical protein